MKLRLPRNLPCGGCGRRLPTFGRCWHGEDDPGPIECDCPVPNPDQIGECGTCRRRVMP